MLFALPFPTFKCSIITNRRSFLPLSSLRKRHSFFRVFHLLLAYTLFDFAARSEEFCQGNANAGNTASAEAENDRNRNRNTNRVLTSIRPRCVLLPSFRLQPPCPQPSRRLSTRASTMEALLPEVQLRSKPISRPSSRLRRIWSEPRGPSPVLDSTL